MVHATAMTAVMNATAHVHRHSFVAPVVNAFHCTTNVIITVAVLTAVMSGIVYAAHFSSSVTMDLVCPHHTAVMAPAHVPTAAMRIIVRVLTMVINVRMVVAICPLKLVMESTTVEIILTSSTAIVVPTTASSVPWACVYHHLPIAMVQGNVLMAAMKLQTAATVHTRVSRATMAVVLADHTCVTARTIAVITAMKSHALVPATNTNVRWGCVSMKHLGVMVTMTALMAAMNCLGVILLVQAMLACVHQLASVFLRLNCAMIIRTVLMTVTKSTALVRVTSTAALTDDAFIEIGCVTGSRTVPSEMTSSWQTVLAAVQTNFNVHMATSV
jgi:hypothetical protein